MERSFSQRHKIHQLHILWHFSLSAAFAELLKLIYRVAIEEDSILVADGTVMGCDAEMDVKINSHGDRVCCCNFMPH